MNQREKFAYLFFYRIRYLLNNYALEVKPVINYHLNNNCVLWNECMKQKYLNTSSYLQLSAEAFS